jgi:DNA-binding NtrC family response regulator
VIKKRLVAIVDDELDIVNLFRDSISMNKAVSVFGFNDPMVALEHFRWNKSSYILIICDLKMPKLCGIEMIKKIKAENPLVRTLLMTAFDVDDRLFDEFTKKQVINGFIQKPIKVQNLLAEVNKQINAYQIGLKARKASSRLDIL